MEALHIYHTFNQSTYKKIDNVRFSVRLNKWGDSASGL